HRLAHRGEILRRGDDVERLFFDANVLGAGLEGGHHHRVLVRVLFGDGDDPFRIKDPGDTPLLAQAPAVLGEGIAQLGDGAVAVVGEGVHHYGGAAGAVTFIGKLVVSDALHFAGASLDRPLAVLRGPAVLAPLL